MPNFAFLKFLFNLKFFVMTGVHVFLSYKNLLIFLGEIFKLLGYSVTLKHLRRGREAVK